MSICLQRDCAGIENQESELLRCVRRFDSNSDGASAVEFAIIMPVFALIIMGIIEFGMLLYAQNSAQNAARNVVRQIAVNRVAANDSAAQSAVGPQLASWIVGSATVHVTQTTPGKPETNIIKLSVSFPANAATGVNFFSSLFAGRSINASVSMSQETPP